MDVESEEHREENRSIASDTPSVAVIMRSKDEQPYAAQTLARLYQQTYTQFTLYNVDSGSTDGTLEALRTANPHEENITQIAPGEYIPGRVLNRMIASVSEPIIVLLNADCVPQSDTWLETLLQPILDDTADAVTGRQIARPDAHFIVKYDLDRAYGDANIANKRHNFFSAAACAFRRSLWEQEQFPEEGWGEDFVWAVRCAKKEARFAIAVDAVVEHSHNYTFKTLYRRERGHGIVHHQMQQEAPSLLRHGLTCAKHMVRDVLYATAKGQLLTIPYNLAYRATFNWAHYSGQLAGHKQQGFPQEFFRS